MRVQENTPKNLLGNQLSKKCLQPLECPLTCPTGTNLTSADQTTLNSTKWSKMFKHQKKPKKLQRIAKLLHRSLTMNKKWKMPLRTFSTTTMPEKSKKPEKAKLSRLRPPRFPTLVKTTWRQKRHFHMKVWITRLRSWRLRERRRKQRRRKIKNKS